ncbi:hypothetical protein WJX72_000121 [[Myrmecia] bisecta]|uniref:non-specific serine/threonine protein kinase n=1 Tax=[Myrmecia] bisecta TaxID=41462 RepID=A0AAW1QDY8_9CHLO
MPSYAHPAELLIGTTQAAPAQQLGIFGGQMNMGARGFNPNTSASTESITIKDSAQSLAQGAGLKHVKVGLNGQAGSRPSSAAWKACDDRAPYVSPYKQTSSPCTPGSPATTRPMSSPGKAAKGISAVSAVRQYLSTVQPPATAGMSPQQPANAKAREDRWAALTGRSPVAKRPATADVVSHKPAVAAEEAAPPATTAANNQMTLQQLLRVRQPGEETRPSSAWVSPSPGPTATAVVAPEAPTTSDSVPGYTVEHTIGEGGFCQVRQGVHHLSGRKVAIKVIDKQRLKEVNDRRRIAREVSVLKGLSHPTIIKLLEVSETPARIYLVMEQASSGSLLDYVRKRKRLSELESCLFLQQIVHGLAYCHSREVVHRDVKLENILLDAHNNIKLIDFGLCGLTSPGKKLRVHCGSPSYAAPEIVARKAYEGPPVDVWSLGVVLFAMICGHLPFHAANDKKELCNKIMKGVYNTPDYVSVDARDLLGRMLTVDPEKRITFEQVLTHRWVRGAPLWQPPASSAYAVDIDPYSGDIFTDADVLQRLQEGGAGGGCRSETTHEQGRQRAQLVPAGAVCIAPTSASICMILPEENLQGA